MKIRILSFLVVLAMVITFLPLSDFAGEIKAALDVPAASQSAAVNNNKAPVVKPSANTQATENVAKVGNTEYATIDEAIAAWTNGTTLTLLANVTLSD